MKKIEIHQFLPSFSPRDAIGNEAILMRDELRALGHDSEIFCEHRHRALRNQAIEVSGPKMPDLGQNILIFHFSVATGALLRLAHSKSSICLRYHNITPEIFFDPVKDASTYAVCKLGRRQLPMAASIARWGLADSAFNAEDLKFCQMSKINVLPLFRDYEGIANAPRDPSLEGSLKSRGDRKTILFVGRLAPNKCQQDLIQLLKVYHDCVSRNLRLILIGSSYSLGFYNALKEFAKELGLSVAEGSALNGDFDVLFAGGVSDSELATYFSAADAFVCASEHEGFCVPIVEAMRMGVPILAHQSSAVTETIGDGGVVVKKDDHEKFVLALQKIINDESHRLNLIKKGKARYADLALPSVRKKFSDYVKSMVNEFTSDVDFRGL